MDNPEPRDENAVADGLRKVLNSHGHSFHYSVLQRARELLENGDSPWVFEASEFPVRVGSYDTRIDFILRHDRESRYLLAECKRANPATANWCFVRSPYVARNRGHERVYAETALKQAHNAVHAGGDLLTTADVYHLGFELRTNEKGDSGGSSRTQIEEAAAQVLKGVNGFIGFLSKYPHLLTHFAHTPVIPVIFTTAKLWVSDVKLNEAELASGNLPPEAVRAEPRKWLWYQYHLSPSLRHLQPPISKARNITEILENEFARAIAIVSPDGIDEFLDQA